MKRIIPACLIVLALTGCKTSQGQSISIGDAAAASCKFIPSLLTINAVTARLPLLPDPDEYERSIVRYICDAATQYALRPESGGTDPGEKVTFEADGMRFEGKFVK